MQFVRHFDWLLLRLDVNNSMRLSDYLIVYIALELSSVIFWIYHVKEWQKNSPNLQTSRINYTFPNDHINFILSESNIWCLNSILKTFEKFSLYG